MVDPFMKEEAIEVDQLEETNKKNEKKMNYKKYKIRLNNYFRGKEGSPTSSMVSEQLTKMKGSTDICL